MDSEKPQKIKKTKSGSAARPVWAIRLQMALEQAGFVTDRGTVDYKRLGEHFSVVPKTVNHWVDGARDPRFSVVVEIAKMTGCSTDWLLGMEGAAPFAREYRPASNGQ
jgi:hypothetical protein